jgi:hypothetical protein
MKSKRAKLAPIHPGEILREDFLKPLALSINALARALHVPPNHVSGIVNEKARHQCADGVAALAIFRHVPRALARLATGLRIGYGPGHRRGEDRD